MIWTDERAELLKKLWADGLSAGQIKDKLGCVSRNAVIGKAHRMALAPRGQSASTARIHGAKPPKPQPKPKRLPRLMKVNGVLIPRMNPGSSSEQRRAAAAAIAFPPSVVMEPETQSAKCSIMDLTHDRCRWIVGDERKPLEAVYCGGKASKMPWGPFKTPSCPYCDWHADMASSKRAA